MAMAPAIKVTSSIAETIELIKNIRVGIPKISLGINSADFAVEVVELLEVVPEFDYEI